RQHEHGDRSGHVTEDGAARACAGGGVPRPGYLCDRNGRRAGLRSGRAARPDRGVGRDGAVRALLPADHRYRPALSGNRPGVAGADSVAAHLLAVLAAGRVRPGPTLGSALKTGVLWITPNYIAQKLGAYAQ